MEGGTTVRVGLAFRQRPRAGLPAMATREPRLQQFGNAVQAPEIPDASSMVHARARSASAMKMRSRSGSTGFHHTPSIRGPLLGGAVVTLNGLHLIMDGDGIVRMLKPGVLYQDPSGSSCIEVEAPPVIRR